MNLRYLTILSSIMVSLSCPALASAANPCADEVASLDEYRDLGLTGLEMSLESVAEGFRLCTPVLSQSGAWRVTDLPNLVDFADVELQLAAYKIEGSLQLAIEILNGVIAHPSQSPTILPRAYELRARAYYLKAVRARGDERNVAYQDAVADALECLKLLGKPGGELTGKIAEVSLIVSRIADRVERFSNADGWPEHLAKALENAPAIADLAWGWDYVNNARVPDGEALPKGTAAVTAFVLAHYAPLAEDVAALKAACLRHYKADGEGASPIPPQFQCHIASQNVIDTYDVDAPWLQRDLSPDQDYDFLFGEGVPAKWRVDALRSFYQRRSATARLYKKDPRDTLSYIYLSDTLRLSRYLVLNAEDESAGDEPVSEWLSAHNLHTPELRAEAISGWLQPWETDNLRFDWEKKLVVSLSNAQAALQLQAQDQADRQRKAHAYVVAAAPAIVEMEQPENAALLNYRGYLGELARAAREGFYQARSGDPYFKEN